MRQITEHQTFHGLPIKAGPNYGAYPEILTRIESVMRDYTARRSKTFAMTMTVTFPRHTDLDCVPGNMAFSGFMNSLVTNLKRNKLDPAYVWAREQDTATRPHYHLMLLLDGQKIQHPARVFAMAERLWAQRLGLDNVSGLINYDTGYSGMNGVRIHRGNEVEFAAFFGRASYLAKTHSKGNGVPFHGHEFGSSQVC